MGILDTLKTIDEAIDVYVEARNSARNEINQIEESVNEFYSTAANIGSNLNKTFEDTEARRIIEQRIEKLQRRSVALTLFTLLFSITCIIATIVLCVTNNDVVLQLIISNIPFI